MIDIIGQEGKVKRLRGAGPVAYFYGDLETMIW